MTGGGAGGGGVGGGGVGGGGVLVVLTVNVAVALVTEPPEFETTTAKLPASPRVALTILKVEFVAPATVVPDFVHR